MPWYEHGRPFEGYTVVVVAQGPSVVPTEVEEISKIYPTIAIKDTYLYAPNAQVIYACDRSWWFTRWKTDEALRNHKADMVVLDYQKLDTKVPNQYWLKCSGNSGFDFREGYVRHGRNSGHQALNLAANMGGMKIILIGFDMRSLNGKMHCHDRHAEISEDILGNFHDEMMSAAPSLHKKGIKVVNTSLQSRLSCFPKLPIKEAIEWGKYG